MLDEMLGQLSNGVRSCERTLKSDAIRLVLDMRHRFDVILLEQFNHDCLMGLAWKLDAPVIGVSSIGLLPWHYERFGEPMIPSYLPSMYMASSDRMSFVERLQNWILCYSGKFLYRFVNGIPTQVVRSA